MRLLKTAIMGLAPMLLAACGGSTAAPSTAPSAAAAQAAPVSARASSAPAAKPSGGSLIKVTDGISNTGMSYLPHQVALQKGFFQQQGFDVSITLLEVPAMVAAITGGDMQFGDTAFPGAKAAAQGVPLRMVNCHGLGAIYTLALARGVGSVKDLEGKAVATNGLGTDVEIVGRIPQADAEAIYDLTDVQSKFSTEKGAQTKALEAALDAAHADGSIKPTVTLNDVVDLSATPAS